MATSIAILLGLFWFASRYPQMSLTKYAILLLVILIIVPALISRLERDKPLSILTMGEEDTACVLPPAPIDCTEPFGTVLAELSRDYA